MLAAEQEPDEECKNCSSGKTQYYLFEKAAPHKLLAGPEQSKEDLYESPTGETLPKDGIVVEVPPGTILVSELPTDETGKLDETAQPGWFALKDNPSLSGSEITEPKQEYTQGSANRTSRSNSPTTGRDNFQKVTRKIAQRGAAQAIGPVSAEQAAALSGHFAVILDNEVQSRPIINFDENPDGIDGRQGAQISGGFNGEHGLQTAQELATTLQIGALPINLHLISETQVSATLGSQALHDGIKAGIIGLALVILFLLLYYRILGVIAVIGLVAYGTIFFALIKLIPITLTLPGIAGLVLTIGVAADANIVIFERIKEEVRAGRSYVQRDRRRLQTRDLDDRRRERRHHPHRLHPLRPGDRRGQGLRLHARRRHDHLAADRGRLHPGAARHDEQLEIAALAERARGRRRGPQMALRLHGRQPLVLHLLRGDPADRRGRARRPRS